MAAKKELCEETRQQVKRQKLIVVFGTAYLMIAFIVFFCVATSIKLNLMRYKEQLSPVCFKVDDKGIVSLVYLFSVIGVMVAALLWPAFLLFLLFLSFTSGGPTFNF